MDIVNITYLALKTDFNNRILVINENKSSYTGKKFYEDQIELFSNIYKGEKFQNLIFKQYVTAVYSLILEKDPNMRIMIMNNQIFPSDLEEKIKSFETNLNHDQIQDSDSKLFLLSISKLISELIENPDTRRKFEKLNNHEFAEYFADLMLFEKFVAPEDLDFINSLQYIKKGRVNASFKHAMLYTPILQGMSIYLDKIKASYQKQIKQIALKSNKKKKLSSNTETHNFGRILVKKDRLKQIITAIHFKYELLNEEKCSVEDLLTILLAKNFNKLELPIHFYCATNKVAIIMVNLKKFIPEITQRKIQQYGHFYSSKGKMLNSNYLYQAVKKSNQDIKDEIEEFFKHL